MSSGEGHVFVGEVLWPSSRYGHKARRVYFSNRTDAAVSAVCSGRDKSDGSLLTDKTGGACLSLYTAAGIPAETFEIF
jgi:hypothetical protein